MLIAVFILVLCGGLYIVFRPYTITFDLNDGSEKMTVQYGIRSGDVTLGIPERKGYRFTGWTGSGLSKPKRDVTLKRGTLGNKKYKANWSDKLHVTCEDWLVDADGNMIEEITAEVDKFLKSGKSSKDYKVQDRTIEVKAGKEINPSKWGDDKSYKAYSDKYMYIGNSGKKKVKEDETVVYRYFNPVLDVNYRLDGESVSKMEIGNDEVAKFNLYVDGELKAESVADFCRAAPCGSEYTIEVVWTGSGYEYVPEVTRQGRMGNDRNNVSLSFVTRDGEIEATCRDFLVDADGRMIRDISDEVDSYLEAGKSKTGSKYLERTVHVSQGAVVSAGGWGQDTHKGAYHSEYVYIGSSGDVNVKNKNVTVYRFFHCLLDVNGDINGKKEGNTAKVAKFNVYIDDELVAENVTDYYQGIPYGSSYRIELSQYLDYSLQYVPTYLDHGTMGYHEKEAILKFVSRKGNEYCILEDWVVDAEGNRLRNISLEIDTYLKDKKSSYGYSYQNRSIAAYAGEEIDASLLGNDVRRKAFSGQYVYVGSSGKTLIGESGTRLYRYFYPVLDVNCELNGKKKGNIKEIGKFNLYVDGGLYRLHVRDFCDGLPPGSRYEIRNVVTNEKYEFIDSETDAGVMDDMPAEAVLKFVTKQEQ